MNSTHKTEKGFALVATLSLMIVLVILALGLLSLSSITLRNSGRDSAGEVAKANARLALLLAIAELQNTAGDDRRITVDGSIKDGAAHPNAVGVWRSWTPGFLNDPQKLNVDYEAPKDSGFIKWLVSASDADNVTSRSWATNGSLSDPLPLFSELNDGFELTGAKLPLGAGSSKPGVSPGRSPRPRQRRKSMSAAPSPPMSW